MGLPMWKDPEDKDFADIVAKVERAAASRRSAIRREASVRSRRDHASSTDAADRLHNRSQQRARRMREQMSDTMSTEHRIAQLQDEMEQLRQRARMPVRAWARNELRSRGAGRDANEAVNSEARSAAEDGADVNGEDVVEPADTVRQHLPRPSRESNLRFEVSQAHSSRSSSPWRYVAGLRPVMPSPPHTAGSEHRDHSVSDGPLLPFDESPMPELTEGFAPAQARSQPTGDQQPDRRHNDENQGLETPPPASWEAQYPPLRRVSHMSPRPLTRVDGLGDRRRSPSPSSPSQEEPTWTTLLTNMDAAGRSSTSTSFRSSHAASQTGYGRSSQNTSASFGEIGVADDTCDLDLPPGITEEDVYEMRARHRPAREANAMTGRRGLQEHHDRVEVGMFRAILERMHRREDIPDEWWATVGLSPELGRSHS